MGCVLGKEGSSVVVYNGPEGRREIGNGRRSKSNVSVEVSESSEVGASTVENSNGVGNEVVETEKVEKEGRSKGERRKGKANPRLSSFAKSRHGEQVAAGWPPWLSDVLGEALEGWLPRRADSFEKIDKIGQGTYSNVYKARDNITGKIVALKKVRFDNLEPESVKFMAREIVILRRLDHPNVIKLEGLVTSRMSCSLYLVFEYMEHDLAGLAASPGVKFTVEQVKCYMQQLLSGLEHCHKRNVLHRDIKGSNLLLDNGGILKIADFGLATVFNPKHKHPMTSRVVTLWYRPPELLLGATDYSVGIDLWSAGCILAELLAGKPIMPGRTEVEQLHKIYKLCGSPSDEYWKKSKLPNATLFRPREPYKRCISETFKAFPPSSLPLIETLLAIDPAERKTATHALKTEFFTTEPFACDPSSLPKYPPSKEMDAKRRDDEARRGRAASKAQGDGGKRTRTRAVRAYPAPEANAELQPNLDRRRLVSHANAKSKSEKFPPPHEDGGLGVPLGASHHMDPTYIPTDVPFSSNSLSYSVEPVQNWSGPLVDPASAGGARRKKQIANDARAARKEFTSKDK
ncbi:probable serine/threonine-protein kinase At1g54610 [Daucus carota subsp. sativus]|uniref:probable serine/threonine-protein kinase At1g54610 n=1 Tax=Daucus carota subsp. sativus TaxID=79200 RepID=UPI0007E05019|nr:PREDICTED: probable serine/threonine-protein kinase At1g54610 [Daucus carota subsp. sativus]XP_017227313.1 PREDICTED: probable serine/threonine-protein kinase At1g54610 [Daucus carota subsp. sativus]XP_017227314.1 PREDICTED: probable serine/threonine-protein kinase At1g54610 [Daucus carota subsp. sativus]XP_017227316.1 PREDICTED: probable serine/threonine-protein kinase At1g54610 [Daucus carota subsp. sativus]